MSVERAEAHLCRGAPRSASAMRLAASGVSFFLLLAGVLLAPGTVSAASCEWSERFAAEVANYGERALASANDFEARRLARDARPAAIDGAREAKTCGCPEAIPSFEEAALQASYSDRAQNLTAAQQYGRRLKTLGDKALDALRRCPPS
jgi:hypothetical protein